MEILKNAEQIYEKINKLFEFNDKKILEANNFLFKIADYSLIQQLIHMAKKYDFNKQELNELLFLIFQMKEYSTIICNFTYLLLMLKKYDEVFVLVNKIFVAHIGNKWYHSVKTTDYVERNFDRLVEIVKTANIDDKVFIPFLIEIYKCETSKIYSKWKNPALEYLQNFFTDNETWLMNFINDNPEYKYKTFGAIIDFNRSKGIELLVKDFNNPEKCNLKQSISLMKNYKRDVLFFIDSEMPKANFEKQILFINIMLNLEHDNEVVARLQDLYQNTKNPEIKELISTKLAISETINIRTEKQFLYAVKRKIKEPQERTLGIPFDKFNLKFVSGSEVSNAVYSFIIYLFKEEKNLFNLYKLKILENFLEKEGLQEFAKKIFETLSKKDDILQAKWAVRLFSLLASSQLLETYFNFIDMLLTSMRNKEANYFIECLINSKRFEIIDFIKSEIEKQNIFVKENVKKYISSVAMVFNMNEEDIKDMLVPSKFSLGEFDIQRDRLYNAFICAKMYTPMIFKKLFFQNQIYKKLAENLIFGEYRFGRLYNAFIIENNEIKFIVGQTIFENDPQKDADIFIGLVHPLDCYDFKFDKLFNYFSNQNIDQFRKPRFNVNDYNISATTVNRFVGVVINSQQFFQFTFSKGFKPNKADDENLYKSIIHLMPSLNILCEVELEKINSKESKFNTLSNICFYKIDNTLIANGKYITKKYNALSITSIPYRYFDYVLSLVLKASKL